MQLLYFFISCFVIGLFFGCCIGPFIAMRQIDKEFPVKWNK